MAMSESRKKANRKYNAKIYEKFILSLNRNKGLNKSVMQNHIDVTGESLNGFIRRAIEETIEHDKLKG